MHTCVHAHESVHMQEQTQSCGKSNLHIEYIDMGLFSFKIGAVFELIIYGKISF